MLIAFSLTLWPMHGKFFRIWNASKILNRFQIWGLLLTGKISYKITYIVAIFIEFLNHYRYPEARSITRKIIFHAGPTNSGKTYHALERFLTSKSGVYCGPLRLLAVEVFNKSNERGTPCDLVTGEERSFASEDKSQAAHVSCTVEMASVNTPYEVKVA